MDRDKFNVNKIIEESILEVQESDKDLENVEEGVLSESVNLDTSVSNFLGDFDVKAQFEALNGLAKTIHGLPRVKDANKLFEGESKFVQAKTLNEESDEITEATILFIKGEQSAPSMVVAETAGLASGLGALSFARKLRRY